MYSREIWREWLTYSQSARDIFQVDVSPIQFVHFLILSVTFTEGISFFQMCFFYFELNIIVQILSLLVIGLPIKIFSQIAHHDGFEQA